MGPRQIAIVGGGIVGLAVARQVQIARPGTVVTVLEKEREVGTHQTGRNSGVVHAGLYYKPGSLKATLCRRGVSLLKEFCTEHSIPYLEVGKVVVAASAAEIPALEEIYANAERNGVPRLARLDSRGLNEIEPEVAGLSAIHSPTTAIVDFGAVARQLASEIEAKGGEVRVGHPVRRVRQGGGRVAVETGEGASRQWLELGGLIVCAGLGTDRVARMAGLGGEVSIVPFRGEYYRLLGDARRLVRGLVYPVPDPEYPFLGVHLTPRVDGEVLVGPNALLALAFEGYRWSDVSLRDVASYAARRGFWRLVRRHWRTGLGELKGSLSRHSFAELARRYVPILADTDMERAPAGVRAQAVDRAGDLVDDFVIARSDRIVVVRNAPSPAATSSLAIAEHLVDRVL